MLTFMYTLVDYLTLSWELEREPLTVPFVYLVTFKDSTWFPQTIGREV